MILIGDAVSNLESHRDRLPEYCHYMQTGSQSELVVTQVIRYVTSILVCLSYSSDPRLSCLAIHSVCHSVPQQSTISALLSPPSLIAQLPLPKTALNPHWLQLLVSRTRSLDALLVLRSWRWFFGRVRRCLCLQRFFFFLDFLVCSN